MSKMAETPRFNIFEFICKSKRYVASAFSMRAIFQMTRDYLEKGNVEGMVYKNGKEHYPLDSYDVELSKKLAPTTFES